MSRKERDRITVMQGVKSEELNQVQAAELLGGELSASQAYLVLSGSDHSIS